MTRKEYQKQYRESHREAHREANKKWYSENRDKQKCRSSNVGTIYVIKNSVNDRIYIGSTKTKLQYRWTKHRAAIKQYPHLPLYTDMATFGIGNFTIEEIGVCPKDECTKWEQQQIEEFKSKGFELYNQVAARSKCI